MKQVRVKYYSHYNGGKEGFALEIKSTDNEEWGLSYFFPCVRREGADEDEEKNFVHYRIINELKQAIELGYKFQSWS